MIPIYNILYNNAHKITQSSNIAPKTSFYQKINNNHIYNNIIKTSSDHRSRIIIISLILYYYIIRVMKIDPTKENTKLI
jgi:hypothetical protein